MRYFFHVDGLIRNQDTRGYEFRTSRAARMHAVVIAGELLKDSPELVSETGELRIEVLDDNAEVTFTLITLAHVGAAVTQ